MRVIYLSVEYNFSISPIFDSFISFSFFTEDSMDQADADEMDTAIKDSDNEAEEETENESSNTPLTRRKRVSRLYIFNFTFCIFIYAQLYPSEH